MVFILDFSMFYLRLYKARLAGGGTPGPGQTDRWRHAWTRPDWQVEARLDQARLTGGGTPGPGQTDRWRHAWTRPD